MKIKEYELFKTAKKTSAVNQLELVCGNHLSNKNLLFDFSLLDGLDISKEEKEKIKEECMNHCSIVNNTAFVIYNPNDFSVCHTVADFTYCKVYDSITWNLKYVLLLLKHINYYHGERNNVYEKCYSINVKKIDVVSEFDLPANDIEL